MVGSDPTESPEGSAVPHLWEKQRASHRLAQWPAEAHEPTVHTAPSPITHHTRMAQPRGCGQVGPWLPLERGPLGVGGAASGRGSTHVDEVVPVADKQVAQDAGLVEVSQADHVLHAVD